MNDGFNRREFFAILGATAAFPLAARAQKAGKLPTIGFLGPTTASSSRARISAFAQRLHELGWTEGRNVTIEYRWADGRSGRFAPLAAELVRLKVDVIATWGTATVIAVKQATATIPIVFTVVSDPVGTGIVASLARPGGNVTGLSTQHIEAAGKRLELLREIVPGLHRLAIMGNVGNPASALEMREIQNTARKLGLEVVILEIRRAEDIAPALTALEGRADAMFIAPEQLINTNRSQINALALAARLPTMHGFREPVVAGALMSYGPNYLDMFRRTAEMVDKVLRGTRPSDIPVEQPTRFDLVINLKTATALGLDVPAKLLALADEVIE
jgi:putative ABC transport system substrate-binding protein